MLHSLHRLLASPHRVGRVAASRTACPCRARCAACPERTCHDIPFDTCRNLGRAVSLTCRDICLHVTRRALKKKWGNMDPSRPPSVKVARSVCHRKLLPWRLAPLPSRLEIPHPHAKRSRKFSLANLSTRALTTRTHHRSRSSRPVRFSQSVGMCAEDVRPPPPGRHSAWQPAEAFGPLLDRACRSAQDHRVRPDAAGFFVMVPATPWEYSYFG
jgi:hypothetical protein